MAPKINRREFIMGLGALPLMGLQMSPAAQALNRLTSNTNVEKPNVLILVFDTLSALHTNLHGYERNTTPNFSRFAEQANVYHNHYAGGNFTSAGTASLLTGTYPWTHRAFNLHSTVLNELASHNLFAAFDDSYYKVAYTHNLLVTALLHQFRASIDHWKKTRELCLSDRQYSDRLFPSDYNAAYQGEWRTLPGNEIPGSLSLSLVERAIRILKLRSLKDEYAELFPRGIPSLHTLHFVLEDVIDWMLAELNRLPQPFLAYIHVLPPHGPYSARREFVDIFAGDDFQVVEKPEHFATKGKDQAKLNANRRFYDEYLAYTDAEFGRFYDNFQKQSLFDNTLMVVTSDHGELFERGIRGHVTSAVYEPVTRVPLMIKRPGQTAGQDFRAATSCIDLLPTLIAETAQDIPQWCEGELLPGFAAGESGERAVFTVEAKTNPKLAPLDTATIAMVKGDFKLIHNRGYEESPVEFELYDLAQDPEELENIYSSKKEIGAAMSEEMDLQLPEKDRPQR